MGQRFGTAFGVLVGLSLGLGSVPAQSAARPETHAEALPPVTVQPAPSRKMHATAKRAERKRLAPVSTAADKPATPVTTFGSGAPNTGSGQPSAPGMASETSFTGEELNARPATRPGEILEAVPGLIVTQHSGEGKANQYFLRGYNLDHGTDMAIYVDDVPVNMRTHAHSPGHAHGCAC